MVNGLEGLGHDTIIGGYHDNGNVGDLCTPGTHSRKSLVTRGIEESDLPATFKFHSVCTDMLCDATGFTSDHIRIPYIIEQFGLSMVNMSHNRDNGRPGNEVFFTVRFLGDGFLQFNGDKFNRIVKFFRDQHQGFSIEALVNGNHNPQAHAGGYYLDDGYMHEVGQFIHTDKFRNLDDIFIFFFLFFFLQ